MAETNKAESYTTGQRFWKMIATDSKEIWNVYYYSIFTGLVSLSLPLGIQAIVNLIQGGAVNSAWIILVVFVLVGIAINGILQIFQLRITENLQQKIFARAAFEFAYRMPRFKLEALFKKYNPELMNRFFDVLTIQKGLAKILIDISTAALQVLFGLILLSLYHEFFIIFGVFLVLMLYFIFKYFGKRGLETALIESKHKYNTAYWLEELARSAKTFKMAGVSDLPFKRIDTHVDQYIHAREAHFKILVGQYSMLVLFKVIVAAGLLAIGGVLVMEQVMNIGQFVAAEIIILLIISSVEKLIVSLDTIYDVLTGMEKIGQITDIEMEKDEGLDLRAHSPNDGLNVFMDKVTFKYPQAKEESLRNINLEINPGEVVMISGRSGSGRSSLLKLIGGLYHSNKGVVSFNGFPTDNLNVESLRCLIGSCLVGEELFNATIYENISLGRPDIDLGRVQEVVRALGIELFIKNQPQGYDTVLEPSGAGLPKSIVKKILVARAIVGKPKLILLEYTFEYFDEEYKTEVMDYLLDKKHGWTIVASSIDHSFAKRADKIVILSGGRVRQVGKYDEVKDEF